MSDIILKARQHFANFRSPEKLVEIKVPEWDLSIWYWPHLSLGEQRAIKIAAQSGTVIDQQATRMIMDGDGRAVMEIIVRSRDEHGRLLFNESQFSDLLTVDPGVIQRITGEMTDEYSSPESDAKN